MLGSNSSRRAGGRSWSGWQRPATLLRRRRDANHTAMSISFSGFDDLQRQLEEAERAAKALDGQLTNVSFDPDKPETVQAAIRQMEKAVDDKMRPYRGNPLVEELAQTTKEGMREQILREAQKKKS